jgi:hypothetical protein
MIQFRLHFYDGTTWDSAIHHENVPHLLAARANGEQVAGWPSKPVKELEILS